jgi:hypothetical protein
MPRRSVADEEKKRVLQLIFSEIRADHTGGGLKIEFRPKPIWERYVEAVLARQRQEQDTLTPVTTSERKTGLGLAKRTLVLVRRPGDRVVLVRLTKKVIALPRATPTSPGPAGTPRRSRNAASSERPAHLARTRANEKVRQLRPRRLARPVSPR